LGAYKQSKFIKINGCVQGRNCGGGAQRCTPPVFLLGGSPPLLLEIEQQKSLILKSLAVNKKMKG